MSGGHPTVVSIPLVDGTDRIGLLELDYDAWDGGLPAGWERVIAVFVLVLITKSRYSDLWVRARRSEPLSAAAEVQWDLLPPLSCSTDEVAVGGILEPAYEIGGDSFDYAVNGAHAGVRHRRRHRARHVSGVDVGSGDQQPAQRAPQRHRARRGVPPG